MTKPTDKQVAEWLMRKDTAIEKWWSFTLQRFLWTASRFDRPAKETCVATARTKFAAIRKAIRAEQSKGKRG